MPAHFDPNQHMSPAIRPNSPRITSQMHATRISCAHLSTFNVMSEITSLEYHCFKVTSSRGQYLRWKCRHLQVKPSTMIFEPLAMLVAPSSPSYLALCRPHVICTIPVPKDNNSSSAESYYLLTTTSHSLKQDK